MDDYDDRPGNPLAARFHVPMEALAG